MSRGIVTAPHSGAVVWLVHSPEIRDKHWKQRRVHGLDSGFELISPSERSREPNCVSKILTFHTFLPRQ